MMWVTFIIDIETHPKLFQETKIYQSSFSKYYVGNNCKLEKDIVFVDVVRGLFSKKIIKFLD